MKRLPISLAALPLAVVIGVLFPSAASAASPVQGLATCSPGPGCHYGPVHNSYPNYLTVCSRQDCTFVAAANLVQITTGLKTSAASLKADYAQAGQTYGGGLGMGALWSYWTNVGIDGVQISAVKLYPRDKADLENEVLGFRALIIEMALGDGSYLGATRFSAGTALTVVDGYTPKGPLVVYQDRTIQMTWAQWGSDAKAMWGVTTSIVAPAPAPPPPTAPTATLSLSTLSVPAAGAAVTLTYSSTNATNCTLASSPSLWTTNPATVSCSGTYQLVVPTSTAESQWIFTFTALNATGQSATSTQTLTQTAPVVTTPTAAYTSTNWSGYVVPSSSALITDAQGDFTVPTLNCADAPNGYSAIWVGIGGEQWSPNSSASSGTLLQTGVNANCVNGVQQNYGWFEMFPSQPNHSVEFNNFPVATGDQIQTSVYETTSSQWVTLVSDLNTGLSGIMLTGASWGVGPTSTIHTTGWTVQGTTAQLVYSGGYTAEWIVEDPENMATTNLFPFANFSSVTWTNLASSFTTWSLTQSETWAIVQSGATLAAPTSTSTDGFIDTYSGP
jgi:hypothetical protein